MFFNFIDEHKIFTIIKMDDEQLARECTQIAIDGGLKIIEISAFTPGAFDIAKQISPDKSLMVGINSLLTTDEIKKAKEAGATYISTPYITEEMLGCARENELYVIGNAMTPTEVINIQKMGVDMIGLFPVEPMGGAKYIRMLLDSFPFLKIRAAGGLNIYNFVDMLDAGATAVGLSSSLFDRKTLIRKDFEIFRKKVELFMGRFNMWQTIHSREKDD
ncbi:MAG: bifunctional 4-hydroxy-2-oxoglutarate aldolase/2-dehydro-3-deoxy-phosphogluconate aldolase [Firmicutes bacterium]|nr:bifunctional 4-hydroxy-2-oxoglutarate aldolase/2-dehydro-3-deoxy-phosphogluconate aldolase [Bacillota bacterium]